MAQYDATLSFNALNHYNFEFVLLIIKRLITVDLN